MLDSLVAFLLFFEELAGHDLTVFGPFNGRWRANIGIRVEWVDLLTVIECELVSLLAVFDVAVLSSADHLVIFESVRSLHILVLRVICNYINSTLTIPS